MVRAILEARKTQTRRVIRVKGFEWIHEAKFVHVENPKEGVSEVWWDVIRGVPTCVDQYYDYMKCPYGKPGDLLYVRETWSPKRHNFPTGFPYEYKATAEKDGNPIDEPWKPSIHMPKEAARIWIRVKGVRVERVQDISESDAVMEGCRDSDLVTYKADPVPVISAELTQAAGTVKESFRHLCDSINQKRGFGWEENPWVWVVEFETVNTKGRPQ